MIHAILKKGGEDVTLEDEVTLSQRDAADRTEYGLHPPLRVQSCRTLCGQPRRRVLGGDDRLQ